MRIGIVGGGIGGLYVAYKLGYENYNVTLLESQSKCGGRIQTVYEKNGTISYEAGPWRIPSSHKRAIALFKEFSVHLTPGMSKSPPGTKEKEMSGLTTWQVTALTQTPLRADERDLQTGYADQTHSASGSEPYMSRNSVFHVAPEGFSSLIEKITAAVVQKCTVLCSNKVVNLQRKNGEYVATIRKRLGHNSFDTKTMQFDVIFLCVPPNNWKEWQCMKCAKSLQCAVEAGVLHHIYVSSVKPLPADEHFVDASLGNVVGPQYKSNWWQVSYSSGRIANMWHDYAMSNPKGFTERMQAAVDAFKGGTIEKLRRHYWPFAYHKWKAVPYFNLKQSVQKSVVPNSSLLPSFYCCGEAFSSHQAWIEGALETSELALNAFRHGFYEHEVDGDFVVVEERKIDVTKFKFVHPGSRSALENHMREEVDDLMSHIGHSDKAWAIIHSLRPDISFLHLGCE